MKRFDVEGSWLTPRDRKGSPESGATVPAHSAKKNYRKINSGLSRVALIKATSRNFVGGGKPCDCVLMVGSLESRFYRRFNLFLLKVEPGKRSLGLICRVS